MKILKVWAIFVLAVSSLFAGDYTVDKAHSSVGFKVVNMMISNVKGNFKDFSGEFSIDDNTKQLTALKGVVFVKSVNTDNKKRDDHIKANDMMKENEYPTISFEMRRATQNAVYGNFTMMGVTKEVKFDYDFNGEMVGAKGKKEVGISLKSEILRKEFGLTWNKVLDTGGVALSNEVKIELELRGVAK